MTRMLALAAAAWSVLFAIPSAYWALGGTVGIETITDNLDEFRASVEDGLGMGLTTALWIITVLKLAGAVLAASFLVRDAPLRRVRLAVAGVGGALTVLYGLANLVQHGLYATGVLERDQSEGNTALLWHLWFWDPFWILGGALFLGLALVARRSG